MSTTTNGIGAASADLRALLDRLDSDQDELSRRLTQYEIWTKVKALNDRASYYRSRDSTPSVVTDLLAALRRAQSGETMLTRIAATSEVAALAQKWMLQLIGEALASASGPSWGEIGRCIKKLESDGTVASANITRQAARQRFSKYVVVEVHRLITQCAKLRQEINSQEKRKASIEADDRRNRAEKDRDLEAAQKQIDTLGTLLQARTAQLEDLKHDQRAFERSVV